MSQASLTLGERRFGARIVSFATAPSENAVLIHIGVAIIAYCLVAIVRNELKLERSTYELLQILGISLTDKTPMRDLFEKRENGVSEAQTTPFIPGLLD